MNDKFTNKMNAGNEKFAQELNQVAEADQCQLTLRSRIRGDTESGTSTQTRLVWIFIKQISPTLRWVTMMIVLGLVLSWSIKTSHSSTTTCGK